MDRDQLAEAWWPYCEAWARRMETRHREPLGLYYNAAVDGLLKAIEDFDDRNETLSRSFIDKYLMTSGRDATRTRRRRWNSRPIFALHDTEQGHVIRDGVYEDRDHGNVLADPGSGDEIEAVDARDEVAHLRTLLSDREREALDRRVNGEQLSGADRMVITRSRKWLRKAIKGG